MSEEKNFKVSKCKKYFQTKILRFKPGNVTVDVWMSTMQLHQDRQSTEKYMRLILDMEQAVKKELESKGLAHDPMKVIVFRLNVVEIKKKTKIEKWTQYAEKLVVESGIDLENVLIHNHGGWGLCGPKAYEFENYNVTYKSDDLGLLKFPLPLPHKPFIMVPEIIGWWKFRAWVHEIGHYMHKHYEELNKPRFIKEYEAEKFCLEKIKESGLIDTYDFIDFKYSAVGYLDSHIDRAIKEGSLKCYSDIPEEIVKFLHQCEYMKEALKDKFINMHTDSFETFHNTLRINN